MKSTTLSGVTTRSERAMRYEAAKSMISASSGSSGSNLTSSESHASRTSLWLAASISESIPEG